MKVFLLKDIEKVGMAGEIIKVSDGFGKNFIIPRKLGIVITDANEATYQNKIKSIEHRKEVISTKTSMLAEKINNTTIVIKKKMHENEKLYGSIAQSEVVDLLAEKGIAVSKSQIEFEKSIKAKGTYPVTIKLSSRLKPTVTLKVVSE